MTNDAAPSSVPHPWSKEALLAKAQRYAELMLYYPREEWQFAVWSTLALELLARAALARVSPALLADPKDWLHLYFALGYTPKAPRFQPRSVDIATVFSRIKEAVPEFDARLCEFGIAHLGKRNEELHSGGTPFDGIGNSRWLPTFYEACEVLLKCMGETLAMLFGADEARVAAAMIAAARDDAAKAVGKVVAEHKKAWNGKTGDERAQLDSPAATWATRQKGHRVKCPACESPSIVVGDPIAAPARIIKDDQIVATQSFLPSKFECIACGLKMSGLPQLSATGLGDTYKATFTYDAAEYYAPEDEHEGYEPDFNEP
jgi:hypothetical protein